MSDNKIYWKGFDELTNDLEFVKNADKEFPGYLPIAETNENGATNRRDFLKLMGFGMAAVSLAACEAPVKKAIPYLNKPEDVDPSIPNYYASTYAQDGEYASILVKTREGRPIKIEPNDLSSVSQGAISARILASVLSLYDLARLSRPWINGKEVPKTTTLQEVDTQIANALAGANGNIYLVSHSVLSPSTEAVIRLWAEKYENFKHVSYDSISAYGILKAHEASFGKYAMPTYNFSQADVIVSVGADFLGTWLDCNVYARQYAKTRKLNKQKNTMSKHYQFEAGMSLSGANADVRTMVRPSQEALVIAQLYSEIVGGAGATITENQGGKYKIADRIKQAANDLKNARGRSILVSGSNDPNVQVLVNAINNALGNYGTTIDINTPTNLKKGNDEQMLNFVNEVQAGRVGAVIFYNANPVYDFYKGKELGEALKNVGLTVALSDKMDETTSICKFVLPTYHYLESWDDAEPRPGYYSLTQPAISPLYSLGTRQAQDTLLKLAGVNASYYDFLRSFWRNNIAPKGGNFEEFWVQAVHDGIYEPATARVTTEPQPDQKEEKKNTKENTQKTLENTTTEARIDAGAALAAVLNTYGNKAGGIELQLYQKVSIGSGIMANNPWLQEMPDPITKATWDNYVCISKAMADKLQVVDGDIVNLKAEGAGSVELPVLIQPGQQRDTVSIAVGYGRIKSVGKVCEGVGKDVYSFVNLTNNSRTYALFNVSVTKGNGNIKLARTQTHHTIMGRDIVRETSLTQYQKDAEILNKKYEITIMTADGPKRPTDISMWKGHEELYNRNHWWGMAIDLNACIGCGACVIGCQSENNVPVVGKKEVINAREMHWIRIDRYFSSDADMEDKSIGGFEKMEVASEDPAVVFQPMLCQHCNNAPCETVCPVIATSHSSEGLNQMTYNRCIGTRYCANNCPYKVRRFNWFNYTNDEKFTDVNFMSQTDLGRMVLNPDVTVRSRGVIEKCSFCVQKIQAGKLNARKEKRRVIDGEIKTACQTACPTEAIIFGDMNDPESQVVKILDIKKDQEATDKGPASGHIELGDPRAYFVLEEINVRPNIGYLAKIRNKAEENKNS